MKVLKALEKLEAHSTYKKWRENNPDDYLVNFFLFIHDPSLKEEWQIGYYSKEKDEITTFNVGKKVVLNPSSEVFKKEKIIEELDKKQIMIDYDVALKQAYEYQQKNHSQDRPMKIIIILQVLNNTTLYNITFVTQTFKTLNVKVSSKKAEIISTDIRSIMDLAQKNK
ncbi:hypothetical protein GOV05_02465 [Candidatus Woesearchaeota archaeon]|nr:hypothetical protein [Candidatus Woesearchaeota archaeon]